MKYFLHDSNAFNDEKITQLFIKFGYEGVGLFYTILEKLAQQEKPVLTDVLKHQLKVGKKLNKIWLFMESIELISSNNGETFNEQLLNFSEKYQIKKQKNTERISQWRDNQKVIKNVTRYESVGNTSKVKESKVKEIKNKTDFEIFNLKSLCLYSAKEIGKHLKEDMYVLQVLENDLKLSREEIYKLIDRFLKDQALNLHRSFGEISKHLQNWAKKQEKETSGKLIYPGNINKK